ncbi:ran-binding protein 3-like isoform X7 [Podarcis muralis]
MRNQQIPASRVNDLCAGIGASCTEHRSQLSHFIKRRDPSDTWTMNQAADTTTNLYMFHTLDNSKHKDEGRSVIAQPIFVFKKERPCKVRTEASPSCISPDNTSGRPAEDPVCKTEKVKKNNIFMTSALLQKNTAVKETEKGLPSTNVQRDVLRPATLQPPQVPLRKPVEKIEIENVLEDKHESDTEVSGDTCLWADDSERPLPPFHISGLETISNQLPEGKTFSSSRHSDFVFGENIVERVLRPAKSPELHSESGNNGKKSTSPIGFHTRSPQTTPFFAKDTTLVESAAAYVSSKPTQRYLLDKVEVTTGEEAEHNVLQINCRLFLFNKVSSTWTERGSGSLRLNDTSSNHCGMLQSRLIMRNHGSMRLILNTRLWTQMVIERANRKSLCITATDLEDSCVKVFLIQASSKDAASLYAAIHHRLVAMRSFADQECDVNHGEQEPDIQPLNYDSDEDENEKITQVSSNKSDHSQWIRRQPVVCS